MTTIEVYTTKECPKCVRICDQLDKMKISYKKRVIDADPEAETDALMYNICAVPAIVKGTKVLKTRDLFNNDALNISTIRGFLIQKDDDE